MVVICPFGVLLITGRLEGVGCNEDGSRVRVMGEDDRSWKWESLFQICQSSFQSSFLT